MRVRPAAVLLALAVATASAPVAAGGGPLGIDRVVTKDERGLWDPDVQTGVQRALIAASWAGALIEGTETRLGRTWWRSAEAGLAASAGTVVAKRVFTRQRPSDGGDPDAWFRGRPNESFPSGHVATSTAIVAPFIAEYRADHPQVWALALVPAYLAVGRVKVQAHWQTDVLGGVALGLAGAWFASVPDSPWVLQVLGDGTFVGLRHRW